MESQKTRENEPQKTNETQAKKEWWRKMYARPFWRHKGPTFGQMVMRRRNKVARPSALRFTSCLLQTFRDNAKKRMEAKKNHIRMDPQHTKPRW